MNQLRAFVLTIVTATMVLPITVESQELPKDEKSGFFSYHEVVKVDSISADELYSRAKSWIALTYKSANDVIQLDDQNAGRIIVKGNFEIIYYANQAWVNHTLTIDFKEGRYRYDLTSFVFDNGQWSAPLEDEKKFWGQKKKLHKQVSERANAILLTLREAMEKSSPASDDDW